MDVGDPHIHCKFLHPSGNKFSTVQLMILFLPLVKELSVRCFPSKSKFYLLTQIWKKIDSYFTCSSRQTKHNFPFLK